MSLPKLLQIIDARGVFPSLWSYPNVIFQDHLCWLTISLSLSRALPSAFQLPLPLQAATKRHSWSRWEPTEGLCQHSRLYACSLICSWQNYHLSVIAIISHNNRTSLHVLRLICTGWVLPKSDMLLRCSNLYQLPATKGNCAPSDQKSERGPLSTLTSQNG